MATSCQCCRMVVMNHVGILVLVNESFLNKEVPGGCNDLIDFARLIILKMIFDRLKKKSFLIL
jgi:hypothetical protein